jgi:hypothetical protein
LDSGGYTDAANGPIVVCEAGLPGLDRTVAPVGRSLKCLCATARSGSENAIYVFFSDKIVFLFHCEPRVPHERLRNKSDSWDTSSCFSEMALRTIGGESDTGPMPAPCKVHIGSTGGRFAPEGSAPGVEWEFTIGFRWSLV